MTSESSEEQQQQQQECQKENEQQLRAEEEMESHEESSQNDDDIDDGVDDEEDDEDDSEDDDDDDDDDDEEEDNENSSVILDDDVPTCYICLNAFEGQDIGAPESCENIHEFCFDCIEEWSKRVNTCPIDRREFLTILVRKEPGGDVVSRVPVIHEPEVEDVLPFPDVTYCEVCNHCDREDRLLLCDGCDHGYHLECLSPPLATIPIDEWFCPVCVPVMRPHESVELGEEDEQLAHFQRTRRIARTGMFELVRSRIATRRIQTIEATPSRSRSTSTTRKRKSTKTRKSTKKTTKRKRKSKKRTSKSRKSAKRLPPNRAQIAKKLNICRLPKSHHGFPTMETSASLAEKERISSSLGRSVSLFGSEKSFFEMRSYEVAFEDQDDDRDGGGVGVMSSAHPSTHVRGPKKLVFAPPSSANLLDDILSGSSLLFEKPGSTYIGRDGKIHRHEWASPSKSSVGVKKATNGNENGTTSNGNSSKPTSSGSTQSSSQNSSSSNGFQQSPQKSASTQQSSSTSQPSNGQRNHEISLNSTTQLFIDEDIDDDDEDIDGVEMKEEDDEEKKKKEEKNGDQEQKQEDGDEPAPRRPSVKDLFGGDDSDEEFDDDLRKKIMEKGGVDPHFPMKLPIIFKTNFTETKKKIEEQETSIAKKWISIHPEPVQPKPQQDGPKWRSIDDGASTSKSVEEKPEAAEDIKEEQKSEPLADAPKSEKKVRFCKHGKKLKDKKNHARDRNKASSIESSTPDSALKPLIEPKSEESTSNLNEEPKSSSEIDEKPIEVDTKTEEVPVISGAPVGETKIESRRSRTPEERKERSKRRSDEERRRDDDRRRRRSRSRSRDRRDRRRGDSRHRSTKDDKSRTTSSRKRSRSRESESRHRSSRHKHSRRHRSRDRSHDRSRERRSEDRRDDRRRRDHRRDDDRRTEIKKIDMKFESRGKTPDSPEKKLSTALIDEISKPKFSNFLPRKVEKQSLKSHDSFDKSYSPPVEHISRTPIRDESPSPNSSRGKKNVTKDVFYDADYPAELRDGFKEEEDAPYSPGYSPNEYADTMAKKPDPPGSIKPFTNSQMNDILAMAKKTLRGGLNKHEASNNKNIAATLSSSIFSPPKKSKKPETKDNTEMVDMELSSDDDDGDHFGDGGGSVFSDGSYEPSESNRLVDAWEKIQSKTPKNLHDKSKSKKNPKETKEKFIEKMHRQERVASEVKLYLKPFFQKRKITKEDYKQILKKAVTKICENKKGIIQSNKIEKLVQDYVKRFRYLTKKTTNGVNG